VTPENSIRIKTWVTNDGRYLTVDEISDDHLLNIQLMLFIGMTPGYDLGAGRAWIARCEKLHDYLTDGPLEGLDRDAYAAAWVKILDDECTTRRKTGAP
jgi:hypothetical protein